MVRAPLVEREFGDPQKVELKTAPVLGRLTAELIQSAEEGRDTDRDPLRFRLPRVGMSVDTAFLSRNRGEMQTSGTVIG